MHQSAFPHVFVTNGGGVPKRQKAENISKILQVAPEWLSERLVCAHDPIWETLKSEGLEKERILIISKSEQYSRGMGVEWGLTDVKVMEDYEQDAPWIWPLKDDQREIKFE
jgi:ribonucleotide monophosphatase NagD (HAD superfamily)